MHVAVVDRDAQSADETVEQLAELGTPGLAVAGDVGDADLADRTVDAALAAYGRLDALVNGAQAMRNGVPFAEHTDADFDLAISTGLWGAFRFMRAAFAPLREPRRIDRQHRVVGGNPRSRRVRRVRRRQGGHPRADEGGRQRVGPVRDPRQRDLPAGHVGGRRGVLRRPSRAARRPRWRMRPIKRDGDAEADIGRTVVFLVGPDSRFITGVTLMVNGGLTIMP